MTSTTNASTVRLIASMGDDLTVVNAARVSLAKESPELSEADARLIAYLARNEHWTPFSHVMLTFHISMPVFVARQWFRHTVGITRNEVSRRYVDDDVTFYLPDVIRSRPDGSIKQGSGGAHPDNDRWRWAMLQHLADSERLYEMMIRDSVAPEQARIVLPLAHMTEFHETGSLAAYARICKLRLDGHAQAEITDVAARIATLVRGVAPLSWDALVPA